MNTAGIEKMINLYGWGARICLLIVIVGAAFAVFCFFRFNIRQIYRIRSGKARQEMVKKMNERNRMTGEPYERVVREMDSAEETTALYLANAPAITEGTRRTLQQETAAVGFRITECTIVSHTEEYIDKDSRGE